MARTKSVFSKIKKIILLHYHEYAADFEPADGKDLFTLAPKSQDLTMDLYDDGGGFFYTSVQDIQMVELKDKQSWRRFMSEPKPHREHKVQEDTLEVKQIETGLYRAAYILNVSIAGRGELRFKVTMNFKLNEAGELKILNCLQEGI